MHGVRGVIIYADPEIGKGAAGHTGLIGNPERRHVFGASVDLSKSETGVPSRMRGIDALPGEDVVIGSHGAEGISQTRHGGRERAGDEKEKRHDHERAWEDARRFDVFFHSASTD